MARCGVGPGLFLNACDSGVDEDPENNPLWVDFQINMETNEKLSYTNLEKIFKKIIKDD